ncbi:MAG TPA: SMP-30/gluconolactonase/LRE family protein [Candidatus Nitrosocosmicus sp.]|nr:SMP-30/gluconolactonase/LRE family protein [Candidatus Nitrosocosmicus sp.]
MENLTVSESHHEEQATPVFGNYRLGEGAIWSPDNVLLGVDILGRKVWSYNPTHSSLKEISVPQDVGTVVPTKTGDFLLATQEGIATLNPSTEDFNVIKILNNDPNIRFNDGKCDPQGRFWAGTMAYDFGAHPRAGSLYRIDTDLSVEKVIGEVTISNGLVWTDNTFYYIDTPTHQVVAYDYDPETGNISNRRSVIEIEPGLGNPDGMTIDADGMLWIALWGEGYVGRFDPRTGRLLQKITTTGAKQVSSVAFGGKNLNILYITTAYDCIDDVGFIEQPNAGKVFAYEVDDTQGIPACVFGK